MSEPVTEAALIEAAQGGDRTAIGQLLLSYSDQLSRQLQARLSPTLQRTASPDDILQQVFAVAFREIKQFEHRGPGSFSAWLRTICDRQLKDLIRRAGRQKRGGHLRQVEATAGDAESAWNLIEQLDAGSDSPSLALRKEEALTALNVAVAELPDDYREVIRLRFYRGLSLDETAATMNRTPAAIRSLTDRAKKQLRGAIGRLSQFLSSS